MMLSGGDFLKIKEVLDQTGLTDRAVRLYIEHGLVTPENQKSYTGRNHYNFTQEDLDRLEQIALLRKADFSLEQIKALQSGGEAAREVLLAYLSVKQESVVTGQKVLEALKDFPAQEAVTIESVCAKIKESIENSPIPDSDKKETKGERVEKWLMRSVAIVILALWGLLGMGVAITYREDFPFPRYYTNLIHYIGVAYILIPIVAAIMVLFSYRKYALLPKARKKRRWVAGGAIAIAFFVMIQPIGIAAIGFVPPMYSETKDPENYLVMGTYPKMYGDDLSKLFPANIPRSAVAEGSGWYPPDKFLDTTKYYYYFQDFFDPSFQIYAEWVLPEEEFNEELRRIQNNYPEGAVQQAQWGDWTCLSFTDDTLDFAEAKDLIGYYYLIFAYNEKTGAVRYIASYSMSCGTEEDPYFLLLPWE